MSILSADSRTPRGRPLVHYQRFASCVPRTTAYAALAPINPYAARAAAPLPNIARTASKFARPTRPQFNAPISRYLPKYAHEYYPDPQQRGG